MPRPEWRRRLRLLRQAGGNAITTYVPWLLHEPKEGRFVFAGADHLALEPFLEAVAEAGLQAIVRPGPYVPLSWHISAHRKDVA